MGVHIAVDGGDVFLGGDSIGGEGGRGWVLVDTGYLCLFLCFLFKWMLGGPFFLLGGGGGDSVGGEGGGGGCL